MPEDELTILKMPFHGTIHDTFSDTTSYTTHRAMVYYFTEKLPFLQDFQEWAMYMKCMPRTNEELFTLNMLKITSF